MIRPCTPMVSKAHSARVAILVALTVLVAACAPAATTPSTAIPTSTATVAPTHTVAPTFTSTPTSAPTPTHTATPKHTPTQTPLPTNTPVLPTAAPPSDLLRPVTPVDEALSETSKRLHASPDGALWLITDKSIARIQDEAWHVYLADFTGELAGIDAADRAWVVSGDTTQIATWDGTSWTAYGADEGWFPIPLEDGYRDVGWGQSNGLGQFWLATSQDVRVFDGERWTVFTRGDMGMDPPLHDGLISVFEVTVLSGGEVWVGECEGAAGPIDGRGLRWFDGQTWHGADSPVASGCVTAIVEDSSGHIWVGASDVLWRYDPASEDWEQFTPPEPPDPPPLGQWRYAASYVAMDPSDDPWVSFLICGAASCDTMALYHVHERTWTRIEIPEPVTLDFDAAGTPWLFSVNAVFRVAGDVPELVANLYAESFTVDASGQVWFLAWHEGQDWLWTLDTGTGE